jgi:hypothetical protein
VARFSHSGCVLPVGGDTVDPRSLLAGALLIAGVLALVHQPCTRLPSFVPSRLAIQGTMVRARPLIKSELQQFCGILRIQANELTTKGYLDAIRDFLRMQNYSNPNVPDDQPFPMRVRGPVPAAGASPEGEVPKAEGPNEADEDPSDPEEGPDRPG